MDDEGYFIMVSHVNAPTPTRHKNEVSGVLFEKKELARVEGVKEKTPSYEKAKSKKEKGKVPVEYHRHM